jgi:mRNA interferase MazF
MVSLKQGDIYRVRFGTARDSGPGGKRPAIVIQNDILNASNINATVVALLTSNQKLARVPGNVLLSRGMANLPKTSVVVVSQIATIDKSRVLAQIGTLDKKNMEDIIHGCEWVISLR